jgi:hypothetical protein
MISELLFIFLFPSTFILFSFGSEKLGSWIFLIFDLVTFFNISTILFRFYEIYFNALFE